MAGSKLASFHEEIGGGTSFPEASTGADSYFEKSTVDFST